ncbi:hypothetical protein BRADI_3g09534v3 [Brachypodium distachyon]|uniref:Endonuclease/exonuclease/phosphatase domain-containing protein n=1 Tax=Brachypodium distachyon TaxID=15368 RepID=A0A2K2CW73_BRADI|nr:hypothetical protein BRADI_3g09534v3 [Brachypodium distachyon]
MEGDGDTSQTNADVLPEEELLELAADSRAPLPAADITLLASSCGLLTAWDDGEWVCSSCSLGSFCITCSFQSRVSDLALSVTNVYGPCDPADKPSFLDELVQTGQSVSGPWAILGDFNLILRPSERSNANFNFVDAAAFTDTINSFDLQELPLLGRSFTWSNQQLTPILVRLDRALVNLAWSTTFPDSTTSFLPRATSDHVPIILSAATNVPKPTIFRFNSHLLASAPFCQRARHVWLSFGPAHRSKGQPGLLCRRLKRVREETKKWMRQSRSPQALAKNFLIVISFLDRIEEFRPLAAPEFSLRAATVKSPDDQPLLQTKGVAT